MKLKHRTWKRPDAACLGWLACACFLSQPLLGTLHFALHEHTVAKGQNGNAERVHSRAGPGHGHGDHQHGEQGPHAAGDPEPHPLMDHEDELSAPAVRPKGVLTAWAPVPARAALLAFDLPAQERPEREQLGPRPPPPRSTAAPRAPPIAS